MRREPWKQTGAPRTFQTGWVKDGAERKPAPYLEPLRGSPRAGWLIDRLVEDDAGAWRTSNRLDSADFGNASLYCAIGAFGVEDLPDLSRVIKLCGPRKRDIPLSPPHYDLPGGFAYRAIDATRLLLYGCVYAIGGQRRSLLFRELPVQHQRRVRGTLMTPEGVVKGNPDTAVYAGMTPLFVVDMPYTGTDKRRGGDSGVLLAAVIDYPVGLRPCWTGFTVRPHVPRACRRISVSGLRLAGGRLDVEAGRWGARVGYRGCELAKLPPGAGLAWDASSGSGKRLKRKGEGA